MKSSINHFRQMRQWLLVMTCLALVSTAFGQNAKSPAAEGKAAETGFQTIFNGQNLEGWGGPTDSFEAKEGVLVCRAGEAGTIYTQDAYANFVARLEYQLVPGSDEVHGVAIRYPGSGSPAYVGMCRIQIRDEKASGYEKLDPREKNGSAFGLAAAQQGHARPTGEWNQLEITVNASTVKVVLNGAEILETDLSTVTEFMADHPHPGRNRRAGHFGVSAGSEDVKFRNIQIKRLPRTRK